MTVRVVLPVLLVGMVGLRASPPASHEVIQKDRAFSLPALTIRVGDSLRFVNADSVVHNVFAMAPGIAFDLKTQSPGTSTTIAFRTVGASDVRCAIHPGMKLQLKVIE